MVRCISFLVAGTAVTAYSFGSQVFVWIGKADFGGKLFELFLFHVGTIVFLPCFVATKSCKDIVGEYTSTGKPVSSLGMNVLIAALFQMNTYYLWFLASVRIPTQALAAIFQSSIAVVYILSVVFLDERVTQAKNIGVVLAILGVVITSVATANAALPPGNGAPTANSTSTAIASGGGDDKPDEIQNEIFLGLCFAVAAELSKSCYQVWFKKNLGSPSGLFMLLFGSLVSVAHIFPILPVIVILGAFGFSDARIGFDATGQAVGLTLLAAINAATVNIGFLMVIALETPLFLASMQLLAIPLSVLFDATIHSPPINPSLQCIPGYILIFIAFVFLNRQTVEGYPDGDTPGAQAPTSRNVEDALASGDGMELEVPGSSYSSAGRRFSS